MLYSSNIAFFDFLPVVMSADLIAALLQSGCIALISAADAAICGQDMEVPEYKLYDVDRLSYGVHFVGPSAPLHAAKIFTPGAAMSGCHQIQ